MVGYSSCVFWVAYVLVSKIPVPTRVISVCVCKKRIWFEFGLEKLFVSGAFFY